MEEAASAKSDLHKARHEDPTGRFRCLPHALPFECLFAELWARRATELAANIRSLFGVPAGAERSTLDQAIQRSSDAYANLFDSKEEKAYGECEEALCEEADDKLLKLLHSMHSSALCFSGGGIRSASFCLGVLQGLARFGFKVMDVDATKKTHALAELDYLSTVSGGGYIGSWLMAWTKRVADPPLRDPIRPRTSDSAPQPSGKPIDRAFFQVLRALAGLAPTTSGDPAPRAVRHLREYTSFLAPAFGLTLDTWTLISLVFRNLLVNCVMILPLFLFLIASVQLVRFGLFRIASLWVLGSGFYPPFLTAVALFMMAGFMAGIRMPSRQADKLFGAKWEPKTAALLFILPLAISSVLLMALWLQKSEYWSAQSPTVIYRVAFGGFLSFALVPVVRTFLSKEGSRVHRRRVRYLTGLAAAAVTGTLLSLALYGIALNAGDWLNRPGATAASPKQSTTLFTTADHTTIDLSVTSPATATPPNTATESERREVCGALGRVATNRFIIFGFPLVWGLLMAASSLFSGLLGVYEDDIDREWWARAGGLMMYLLAFWTVAQTIAIHAQDVVAGPMSLGKLSSAGLLSGLLGALGGFSTSGSPGAGKKADLSKVGAFLNRFSLLVPAVCGAAILALAILLTDFELWLASYVGDAESVRAHGRIWLLSLAVSLLVNWAINVNLFSLHGMYRMRLMRAFLGSSNTQRKPDPFTGFDDRDLVWETEVPCGPGVPLHLINATVNLVGTRELAWAQRKAEGFTFSPLHCGGWRLGYVPTAHYGSKRGVSLATAMAISGAAFNPNMGYHSSPLVTLIMTLFNVRLGWWLPNPKYERGWLATKGVQLARFLKIPVPGPEQLMEKTSPRLALRPLVDEMLGGTDDRTPYIELSDGGHFENLGLYEMVLRRCTRIIVIDAGSDPKCEFEDLGNALRKIEIDLGIPIEFRKSIAMQSGSKPENLRCAVADIRYACVDGDACHPGTLLYIKAGLNGQEPPDILQYARTHELFPHESTANQFFNESQFESYRHLGSFSIDQIVSGYEARRDAPQAPRVPETNLATFFDMAEFYTGTSPIGRPPSLPPEKGDAVTQAVHGSSQANPMEKLDPVLTLD